MSTRAREFDAEIVGQRLLSPELLRLVLAGPGLAEFDTSGAPDEWLSLVVPGQFQSRYYTVRSWSDGELVIDVVLHQVGLVTEWASTDLVGTSVRVSEARGSFELPEDVTWLWLVGDLTALPAMARVGETFADRASVRIWAETPAPIPDYFPDAVADQVTWLTPRTDGSGLAALVDEFRWPETPGYFWMAGESAQMRAIRRHLMHTGPLPSTHYKVMGYWRANATRRTAAVQAGTETP